ncbi:Arc family DNA-binding protein [Arhodomonas sp. AD133]
MRLPKDLKDWLSEQAEKNYRSMSSEVARRLDESRRMDCDKEAA